MRFGVMAAVSAVILGGAILASGPSSAQSGDLRGPRDLPPPGFRGGQYVDSGGCVFVRAGIAGRTTWVPRIGPDRRQLCGQPPSFAAAPAPPVTVADAPPPETRAAPAPAEPRRAAAEARQVPEATGGRPTGRTTAGCPGHAPHGERLLLTDGRFALVCFRDAGAVPLWAVRQGQPRADCVAAGPALRHRDGTEAALCAPAPALARAAPSDLSAPATLPPLPKGYKPAWTDGRLNPLRARGTPEGQAQQDRIWTRDTPMRLVDPGRPPQAVADGVTMSASGGAGGLFVQVGRYAARANADRAQARLGALGLPAARQDARGAQIVLAGPFADRAAAQAARARLRAAGFGDAFVRPPQP